jgi:hypothetical protein
MSDQFDWDSPGVIHVAPDVCIYTNTKGDIVMRAQVDSMIQDEDSIVVIPQDCAARVIAAMVEIMQAQESHLVTLTRPGSGGQPVQTEIRIPVIRRD